MKWITNMDRSRAEGDPDALDLMSCGSVEEAKKDNREFLRSLVVGRPKATKQCTVVQLEKMGVVGIYEPDRHIIVTPGAAPGQTHQAE